MTTLRQIAEAIPGAHLQGSPGVEIEALTHDSRAVVPGALFASLPGHVQDPRGHLDEALRAGASALLLEPPPHPDAAHQVLVPEARSAYARAAAAVYPTEVAGPRIGITGTNGKTTVAYLLTAILEAAGFSPLLVSSIESRWQGECAEVSNTTPEAGALQQLWHRLQGQGANALVMEASSHGLLLHRVDGLGLNVGVFTNLTRDHLDYHPGFDAYRGAKSRLFGMLPRRGWAVLHRDDPASEFMARATTARVLTYGQTPEAEVHSDRVEVTPAGIELEVCTPGGTLPVRSQLYGAFNVTNLLAAVATGCALKLKPDAIGAGVERLNRVPGRAERIDLGQPFVVLNDFAHTPDALAHILQAARALTTGTLHMVFGCGGDRDAGKRPLMGRVAADGADVITVTSDNPRTEDPQRIIEQITDPLSGDGRVHVEPDRTAAIEQALARAGAGDTVIVAGKGHERYQIIGTDRRHFDDSEVIAGSLRKLGFG